jgi:hypothetical protein
MSIKIYLCGFIGGEHVYDKCAGWRNKLIDYYYLCSGTDLPPDIIWMNPLEGKKRTTLGNDGLKSNIPTNAIVQRDYQSVIRADILIANLDNFGENRQLLGSWFEIAWAFENKIPIIIITDNKLYSLHPFITYVSAAIYDNVDKLIDDKIIEYFISGWNNKRTLGGAK